MNIVICGLTITSSWGNGHATTYRALVKGLSALGHRVAFLERDVPWYREHRDAPAPPGCEVHLYPDLGSLRDRHAERVRGADAVIVGSYVPEGVEVGRWVNRTARGLTAFYDIDTPVTLSKLARRDHEYIDPALVRAYGLYLSFTGGPVLDRLESLHGARRAVPLYCSVDPELYRPVEVQRRFLLGYLGTWSADRQPGVEALLLEVARRRPREAFVVGGPSYPDTAGWPGNVSHLPHVAPPDHPAFYGRQRFTLNVTRADMAAAGFSPSVRLFEAAACGVPLLTDPWEGIETVLRPEEEILVVRSTREVLEALSDTSDRERDRLGRAARSRVLGAHTGQRRAAELGAYLAQSGAAGGPPLAGVRAAEGGAP